MIYSLTNTVKEFEKAEEKNSKIFRWISDFRKLQRSFKRNHEHR